MKFYSEVTKKLYDTEADLNDAESAIKKAECEKKARETKLKNERAARAKVVDGGYWLDVSELTGEHYIQVSCHHSSTKGDIKISQIYIA